MVSLCVGVPTVRVGTPTHNVVVTQVPQPMMFSLGLVGFCLT